MSIRRSINTTNDANNKANVRNLMGKKNQVRLFDKNLKNAFEIKCRFDWTGFLLSCLFGGVLLFGIIFQFCLLRLSNHIELMGERNIPSNYILTRSMIIVFLATIVSPSIYMGIAISHRCDKLQSTLKNKKQSGTAEFRAQFTRENTFRVDMTRSEEHEPDESDKKSGFKQYLCSLTSNGWCFIMMIIMFIAVVVVFSTTGHPSQMASYGELLPYNFRDKKKWGFFRNSMICSLSSVPTSYVIMCIIRYIITENVLNKKLEPDDLRTIDGIDNNDKRKYNGSSSNNPDVNKRLGSQFWGGLFTFFVPGMDDPTQNYHLFNSSFALTLFMELIFFIPLIVWGMIEIMRILYHLSTVCRQSKQTTKMEKARDAVYGIGSVLILFLFFISVMWISNLFQVYNNNNTEG